MQFSAPMPTDQGRATVPGKAFAAGHNRGPSRLRDIAVAIL